MATAPSTIPRGKQMSDLRGGAISEILAASRQADTAGDDTVRTASDTQALVGRMQDEVDGVSAEMQRAYDDLSAQLRDSVQRTSEQLHATEWHGKSRESLVAFDQDLNATLNRFMDSSQEGMAQFRTELMDFLTSYYEVIRGQYTTAMTEIQGKYSDASRAATTYAQDLEQLDNTSITY